MADVITEPNKIKEVLERGVARIFPDKESLKKKLASGEKIRLYCGYDPSAPSLHVGNAATLNKLAQFQNLGHEVIFLVGDFTGMIGDPTDKETTRRKMTREEVLKNAEGYMKQAGGYLKFDGENPAKIRHNSEWSDKMTFKDLIEIASNFTVQQMIQRDMFKKRMKLVEQQAPIYLHEFLYPLAQGYDSVAMDVDLEIGGNDQMFNMLVGRDLQKIINHKEKFVMTLKLLEDEAGKKMGKTEGNAVFLDQSLEDMYGAVMSWTDGVIAIGFEMATDVSMEEVEKIKAALKDKEQNPRDFKMRLAREIVKINYGEEAAEKAQENFINIFQKKKNPLETRTATISGKASIVKGLVDFMVECGFATSRSDARRKIEQEGVKLDEEKITDVNYIITKNDDNKILRVGKLHFVKIVFK